MKKNIYVIPLVAILINILNVQYTYGGGIECFPNRFWGLNTATGTIDEFEFNGNTVTFLGQFNTIPGSSLGICNNLSGGAYSPTFYSTYTTFGPNSVFSTLIFYNGIDWDTSIVLGGNASGCGGYGNHLYFSCGSQGFEMYDGNSPVLYSHSGTGMIADVAVDANENAWLVIYTFQNYAGEIVVVNPFGQVIQTYTISTPTQLGGPFGCFFMYNNLYIGSSNLNAIRPVTFSGNTATLGSLINLPPGNYSDLASCSTPDFTSSVTEINNAIFFPYPNPSTGVFRFSPEKLIESVSIRNILGQEILISNNSEVDLTGFANEIYYYEVKSISGELFSGTLIKN